MHSKAGIVLKWYEDALVRGDLDTIERMYKPASDEKCLLPTGTPSVAETRELIVVLANLVTDLRVRVIHSVENGEWVSAMVEIHGFKIGTESPVYLRWMTMMRIEGDYIVETYPSVNYLNFFEQLGQLPEDTFELLLGGTVLH